jgi:hypothetical protein
VPIARSYQQRSTRLAGHFLLQVLKQKVNASMRIFWNRFLHPLDALFEGPLVQPMFAIECPSPEATNNGRHD